MLNTSVDVYLLCFDREYPNGHKPRHYIGSTPPSRLLERLVEHSSGRGSRLLEVINQAGIGFQCVKVWENVTREFEIRLKRRHKPYIFCPRCMQEKVKDIDPNSEWKPKRAIYEE